MPRVYPNSDKPQGPPSWVPEIDTKMDELCSEINSCLGTGQTPGAGNSCYWASQGGFGPARYNGYFGSKVMFSDPTKEGLLAKLQALLDEIHSAPHGMDQTWVWERFKAN